MAEIWIEDGRPTMRFGDALKAVRDRQPLPAEILEDIDDCLDGTDLSRRGEAFLARCEELEADHG